MEERTKTRARPACRSRSTLWLSTLWPSTPRPSTLRLPAPWLLAAVVAAQGCGSSEPESSAPPISTPLAPVSQASPTPVAAGSAAEPTPVFSNAGFIVWESNRSGAWRLWSSDLVGARPRQLTPDEPRRRHCCPHIAPDGSSIAYLSLPSGRARYLDEDAVGELRLIELAEGTQRRLADAARTYFEHRAAVWIDDDNLHYIAGDGAVMRLNTLTGTGTTALARTGDLSRRWLVDASGRWAATGRGALAPVRNGVLQKETLLPGCQPYFSQDGRWSFWTAGAGGPIDRFDLASGETATLLRKNDPRLPAGRGYLYFPMLSRDGTLLAFAASEGEHDHHRADYDIFVAEVDSATLELIGPARVVAADPAVDRFPDVWRPALTAEREVSSGTDPAPTLRSVWPSRTDGLLWSWSAVGVGPTTDLRRGGDPVNPRRPLDLSRGAVLASDTAKRLHEGLQRTNQMSLELVLTAPARAGDKLAVIVAVGRDSLRENVVLGERSGRLVLRMRIGPKGRGAYAEADLGRLLAGERMHLTINYSPGRTTVFRNGEQALRSRDLRGHFFQWKPYALTVGDRARGGAVWSGRLEALAIYNRPLGASEAQANAHLVAQQED